MTTVAEDRVRVACSQLADALVALAHEQAAAQAKPAAPVELIDVKEAARRLGGMSRSTLYQLMTAGTVQSVTIGGRRLVPSTEVERLAGGDSSRRPSAVPRHSPKAAPGRSSTSSSLDGPRAA